MDIPTSKTENSEKKLSAMLRRLKIIHRLEAQEKMTTMSLAEDFGVTQRTIQQDVKNVLTHFGIGTNSEHELILERPVKKHQTTLYEDERETLALGLSQVEDIDEEHRHHVERIAKKTYVDNVKTPYFIKPETFQPFHTQKELVKELKRAINAHLKIEIFYEGRGITLFPYKIVSFEGIWYLLADGIKDDSIHNYMLSHIDDYEITSERFEPISNLEEILTDMDSQHFVEGHSFDVIVRVYPEIAEYFRLKKHLNSQEIMDYATDGSLKIKFTVNHDEDVDNLIKSWLPHIEVLEPESFKQRIKRELHDYLAKIES